MTSKKSDKANLEKHRTAFFQLGLVIALSVSLLAFEWVSPILEKHEFNGQLKQEEAPYVISEIVPKKEEIVKEKKSEPQKQEPQKTSDKIDVRDKIDSALLQVDLFPKIDYEEKGPTIMVMKEKTIFNTWDVDNLPEFPGGEDALNAYLKKNIRYPFKAIERGTSGPVWVSFIVDEKGAISSIKIAKDIGDGCGEEAVRVVNAMPKWKSAKVNGINVPVRYQVRVNFQIK